MIDVDIVNRMRDGHLIRHYLLASYCYYHMAMSPLTDHAFDRLCVRLLANFDRIDSETYPHKALINKGDLEAGTCLIAAEKFPAIVVHGASAYFTECHNRTIHAKLEPHLLPEPAADAPRRATRVGRSAPAPAPEATVPARRIVRVARTVPPASSPPPGRIQRTKPQGTT